MDEKVCMVAILKNEEPFLDEWILYHRMLGVDHFFLYDDNPCFPLEKFLLPYREFVTVINWYGKEKTMEGRGSQTKAYTHAVEHFTSGYDWVGFIDGDEFVVLKEHTTIQSFLKQFKVASAVSLNWLVFGHNGYYDNPEGLITASLTKRMRLPSRQVKTFVRPEAIESITSPHAPNLKAGIRVDPRCRPYREGTDKERIATAHINHYQCRSFINWMKRAERGDALGSLESTSKCHYWRFTEEGCLRQFVTTIAKDKNEVEDLYMLRYKELLEKQLALLKR